MKNKKVEDMKTLKIYLRNKRRPYVFELSLNHLNKFYGDLNGAEINDIVQLGPLTFMKSDFKYSIEN